MAWVFDSADYALETYMDFIAVLKTYIYGQSSLAYMFVYILANFAFWILTS
jgi:hypothetical protein